MEKKLLIITSIISTILCSSIAFAEYPNCSLSTTQDLDTVGFICKAGNATWRVDMPSHEFQPNSILRMGGKFTDLVSGIKITGMEGFNVAPPPVGSNWPNSESICNSLGFRLPTGYPAYVNGKYGFPNFDSDFEILRNANFWELLRKQSATYLWSSTPLQRNYYTFELMTLSISAESTMYSSFYDNGVICIIP